MALLDFLWRRFKAENDEIKQAIADLGRQMGQGQRVTGAALMQLQEATRKMATREELDALKQQLKDAIQAETTQVTNVIQALKDQLAQGQPITTQDLTDLQEAVAGVQAIDPDALPGGRKRS